MGSHLQPPSQPDRSRLSCPRPKMILVTYKSVAHPQDQRWPDQLTTHHHGEADHLAWLERPFAEALRALEERGRAASGVRQICR